MKKNMLLKTFLIIGIVIITASEATYAACSPTASQTVTGTLGPLKQVVTNGGNLAAVIAESGGALSVDLNPGFRVTTNISTSQAMYLKAECNAGGLVNALSGTGVAGDTFISLANQTVAATAAAVTDSQAAIPIPANNANVIAYPVTPPTSQAGILVYTWNPGLKRWDANLTHKGITNTALTVPAGSIPKNDTFSTADAEGTYQAIITLSFGP